ncbi:STAS domain-containing protein [Streptomyces sp. NPDC057702]|uniref:STAS domain-containing protein n=1 Tax=unclassified Streptomyces TaxID=2593676 RepID=UPI0036808745
MRQWHSEYQARCWYDDANTVVELHGEIDIAAAECLAPRLRRLAAGASHEVVIDLRPVTFIDCSGLSMLCALHELLMVDGRRLRVVATRPVTLKMLRLTRLDHAFVVHGSLREARAATRAPRGPQSPPATGRTAPSAGRAALGAAIASVIPAYPRTRPRPDAPAGRSPNDG